MYCFEKLSDEELQAYGNITWAILDATNSALEYQWKPALEEVIYQAIEYVEDENVVPALESRLLTMFNLVRPKEVSYEYAQDVYIQQREPMEDEEIWITLSVAFEVSAGFCRIHDMEWPDGEWVQRYIVLEDPGCDELYLKVLSPPPPPREKPKSEKPKSEKPPRGAPNNFIGKVYIQPTCPIIERRGMVWVLFSFKDGQLKMWKGSLSKWVGQFCYGVSIKVPFITINLSRPNRDLTSFLWDAEDDDISEYLSRNERFWKWFYLIALRGEIYAAPENSERNSWFRRRTEVGGVSLDKPVKVGSLKRFLGGAFWKDTEKTKMGFTGAWNAKILVGTVDFADGEPFLVLKWIAENKRNRKEWGCEKKIEAGEVEIEVDDDMDVGEE